MEESRPAAPPLPDPERMRRAVADYVAEAHAAYVRAASLLSPAVQGRLPLMSAGPFSVAAVGTRYLHLVATREPLGELAARGSGLSAARTHLARVEGSAPPLAWTLSFFDPVVVPALGLVEERDAPRAEEVRSILGIRTHLYHVTLTPPSDLAPHHAGHTGAGLAGAHAAAAREFEAIRAAIGPEREALASELEGAVVAGLPHAAALLARALAPEDEAVAALAADEPRRADGQAAPGSLDLDALRRAVLHAVRAERSRQGTVA